MARRRGRRTEGWGAARYRAPRSFHRGALALALAGPLMGLLVLGVA